MAGWGLRKEVSELVEAFFLAAGMVVGGVEKAGLTLEGESEKGVGGVCGVDLVEDAAWAAVLVRWVLNGGSSGEEGE